MLEASYLDRAEKNAWTIVQWSKVTFSDKGIIIRFISASCINTAWLGGNQPATDHLLTMLA